MDFEGMLISKVLLERCLIEVREKRLSEEVFVDHIDAWRWINEVFTSHGDTPSIPMVEERFPVLKIEDPCTSLSFIIDELRKRRAYYLVLTSMQEQADHLKALDPRKALESMRECLLKAEVDSRSSRDVNLVTEPERRLEEYRKLEACGGLIGIPSPWPYLDDVTQGFQPEDLIMIAGRAGVGKSWAEVVLAVHCWRLGYRTLLFSREMAVGQIIRRVDAIHAQLPYQRFRSGHLTHDELASWKTALVDMKDTTDFVVTGDDDGCLGVSGVQAKIRSYRPQMVFIDGGYLLEDDRGARAGWERWSHVCQDLKKTAQIERIPILLTHQFSKEGLGEEGDGDTLKYGDVKMWFDVMIGVYQSDEMRASKEMLLKIIKLREGPGNLKWVAEWDLEKMSFEQRSIASDSTEKESRESYTVEY